MKRNSTINDKLEDLARKHLAVSSLSETVSNEHCTISVKQLKKVLSSAMLLGEHHGYNQGYKDASMKCKDSCSPPYMGSLDLV